MPLRSPEVTAVAVHSFEPTEVDEIQLVEGEEVLVLRQQEDEWWLVKKGDNVGLIPSTHVAIVSVKNTAAVAAAAAPNVLPSGWDSCVDDESGEKFYFNELTGLTQWERPVLYQPTSQNKNLKLRRRGRLPVLSSGEDSDNQHSVPKADLLRWKQLREAADIRIVTLRKTLSKNDKVIEIPKAGASLRSLSSPLKRTAGGLSARKPSLTSSKKSSPNNVLLSSGSDDEKAPARPLGELRVKGLRAPKKDKSRYTSPLKSKMQLASLQLPITPTKAATPLKSQSERKERVSTKGSERRSSRDIQQDFEKEEEAGMMYPNCRTIVFPPHDAPAVSYGPPSMPLGLKYVHGYNGNVSKSAGKNVLYVSKSRIIFPAAAVVVVMDTESSEQTFFTGHSSEVSSLALHPARSIVASGQSNGLILLWDVCALQPLGSSDEPLMELNRDGAHGVQCLSFSSDGRLLVAVTGGDTACAQRICVFEWATGVCVASATAGHHVVQATFDPYRDFVTGGCTPVMTPPGTGDDAEYEASYSLISCGGKVVKFWVLRKEFDGTREWEGQDGPDSAPVSYGSQLSSLQSSPFRLLQQRRCKYYLEGKSGSWPGVDDSTACELTCFTFACDRLDISASQSGDDVAGIVSRVLCGSSNGSIFIWQQLDAESKEFIGQRSPLPKGKLLSVVTDAHEGPVSGIDYFNSSLESTRTVSTAQLNVVERENIITCGADGVVNLWQLERVKAFPLEHLAACSVLAMGGERNMGRTVSFSEDGAQAVLGCSTNSLLLLTLHVPPGDMLAAPLLAGHSGEICSLAVQSPTPCLSFCGSPDAPPLYFATLSRDGAVRVWDAGSHLMVALVLVATPSCVAFTPNGTGLAVGTSEGELVIFGLRALGAVMADAANNVEVIMKKMVASKPSSASHGKKEGAMRREVTHLKYSPDGKMLAVTEDTAQHHIHLLSVRNSYKSLGVCRGHGARVGGLDFSSDGRVLQSFDSSSELLHWDTTKAEKVEGECVRDAQWQSWTSPLGWSVQGAFNTGGPKKEVFPPAVCRSNGGTLLAAGSSALCLFNYPCPPSASPSVYGGNAHPVTDVLFLPGDRDLVTVSGADSVVFHWAVNS